jgi:catechol 2,3-dioxygenase-like lactoylglutathione lyase family enzyme
MSQIRVARPTRDLAAVSAFYGDALALPMVTSFDDHEGFSGVVFALADASRQLELVFHPGVAPTPTSEDQLVLYLGSTERVEEHAVRIRAAGFEPRPSPNPYWQRAGAVCFVDPDGYWLVLSPETW